MSTKRVKPPRDFLVADAIAARPQPTPDLLAQAFSRGLRECLTGEQMGLVLERNRRPDMRGCCASHDFCDANMVMLAAYSDLMDLTEAEIDGLELDGVMDLFNAAWDAAKAAEFWDGTPSEGWLARNPG
jgi:hypothetical protein